MPSKKSSKKPQKRFCRNCKKIGHNRSTCPDFKRVPKATPPVSSPLKFFVHHVNVPPPTSPHVVNLKENGNNELWKTVESSAPEKTSEILHTYHSENTEIKPEKITPKPDLFVDLGRSKTSSSDFLKSVRDEEKELKKKTIKLKPNLKFLTKPAFDKAAAKRTLKNAVVFGVLASLVLILPRPVEGYYNSLNSTKNTIVENSMAGFLALQGSTAELRSGNISGAENSTKAALDKFNIALDTLDTKHTIMQTILTMVPYVNGEIRGREKILLAGQEIAVGNTYLLSALHSIENSDLTFTKKMDILISALHLSNPNYKQAVANLSEVDLSSLPFEYQQQFKDFRDLFSNLVGDFDKISDLNSSIQEIFGGMGRRRYLLVFQNTHELRPTGGFIGSFAVIDVKDGKIVNIDVPAGGSYDLQGQLPDYLIPPLPLTLTNKRWEFQDGNWYPDFPSSAEKLLWFYNRSRNVTADGVIAINSSVLERILAVMGPIKDSKRGLNISADNAISLIQGIVEDGPEKKDGKPKQILADLAPQILNNLEGISPNSLLPLFAALGESISEKDIQAYFTDAQTENDVKALGWSGEMRDTPKDSDYLFVVNTNLQGQKSDAKIHQTISHQSIVEEDGSVTDSVVILREHSGVPGEKYYGVPNVDYIRVYVPEGSTLTSASGFVWPPETNFRVPDAWFKEDPDLQKHETEISIDQESGTRITNEFNKTAFGNWIITEPGKTSIIQFTYRLPFKVVNRENQPKNILEKALQNFNKPLRDFQLVVQKQSGIDSDFESQIIFPTTWQPTWQQGENIVTARNGFKIEKTSLDKDRVWSVLMSQNNE